MTDFSIEFDKKELALIQKTLGINLESILEDVIDESASHQQNTAQRLIKERIYNSYTPKVYRRTGSALKGRKILKRGHLRKDIQEDSRIGGANKNYNPFLNKNTSPLLTPSLRKHFNSNYYDDSIEYTKNFAKGYTEYRISKAMNLKTKPFIKNT